jgi:hypothetical protein
MRHVRDKTAYLAAALALIAATVTALTSKLGTDYPADAGPAIDAMLRGDWGDALAQQPQMGQLSLFLRWPAAKLAEALGGGELWVYRAGALTCLLGGVALAAALVTVSRRRAEAERRHHDPRAALVLLLVVTLVANPVAVRALELGHPEEMLGAILCAGAVLLALGGRATAAGVVLGLALATKQWALLAVGPALLAAPAGRDRVRIAAWAALVAAVWTLPPLIAHPQAFFDALDRPARGLHEMRPGNVWSLVFGPSKVVSLGGTAEQAVTFVPGWLRAIAHPGVAVLGLVLPLLWMRRRPAARGADALALLALILLVRCALDPWNHEYYHLPFLTALAAWEVAACRRAPVLTACSSALLWVVFARLVDGSGASTLGDVVYVAWAAVVAAQLARMLWWPRAHVVLRHAGEAVTVR